MDQDTKQLLNMLKSADEEARADAREELTLQMSDEIAHAFLEIAKGSQDDRVRADTIIGLGPVIEEAGLDYADSDSDDLGDMGPGVARATLETIQRELRAIFEDESQPKLVRRSALEALVRDPQQWHADAIRKLAASDDPEWRITGVFAMGYVPGFESDIMTSMQTSEGALLYEAVRAAGRAEITEAVPHLRTIAVDERADAGLRAAAIEALPYVDDEADELLEQLADHENEEIASAAEFALEELSIMAQAEEEDA